RLRAVCSISGVIFAANSSASNNVAQDSAEAPRRIRLDGSKLRPQDHQTKSDSACSPLSPLGETVVVPDWPCDNCACSSFVKTSSRLVIDGLMWVTLVDSPRRWPAPFDVVTPTEHRMRLNL